MEEKFFREFVDWVKDFVDEEIGVSGQYKKCLQEMGGISEKISKCLGGTELLDEYTDKCTEADNLREYMLCAKILKVFAGLLSFCGMVK